MNLNDDTMLRDYDPRYREQEPGRFKLYLFIACLCSMSFLYFLSLKGYLPHYTLMIDGNKWEWVRDDPKYLASLAPKPLGEVDLHNQQIIAKNKAEFERRQADQQQYVQEVQNSIQSSVESQPVQQATQTGVITKCLSAAGRVVYQEQACEATGLKPVKVLSETELKGSRADAQNTQILKQVTENNYQPAVASINPNGKQDSEYCRDIESQRENIRSQQRINSRQWHRDEYTRLSKRWQAECLG
nr:hypothetical protein [uncultured Deefgea sp.]